MFTYSCFANEFPSKSIAIKEISQEKQVIRGSNVTHRWRHPENTSRFYILSETFN